MHPRSSLVVVALALILACTASAVTAAGGYRRSATDVLNRLVPPRIGQAYFGFTFRLWDSTDPVVGDSRPFDARIQDSIQTELDGKTPTFLAVWAGWQDPANHGHQLLPFRDRKSVV